MFLINFKTYPQTTGDNAVKMALACELAQEDTGVTIVPVVTPIDLWRVTQHTDLPVWIQHIDPHSQGRHTGFTTVESVISAGANGTILNHSEHPLTFDTLEETVKRIRKIDPDFKITICVPDLEKLKHVLELEPHYLAYEPPELIGNETISVASEKAEMIQEAVKAAGSIPLIVGAGIKDETDIKISLEKGAGGILLSTAVVKAEEPKKVLAGLARAFKT